MPNFPQMKMPFDYNYNTLKSCFTTQQVQGVTPFVPIVNFKNKVPMAQSQPSTNARIANILYYDKHALNGCNVITVPIYNPTNNGNDVSWQFHKYKN